MITTATQTLLPYLSLQTRMEFRHYKNLVPNSPLHRHLEQLLRENQGSLPLEVVCEEVLALPNLSSEVATSLVQALIEYDYRIEMNGDGRVEWVEPSAETLWQSKPRFAVLDLETTNGARNDQRVIELGLCLVESGRITEMWSSLVNPERRIPYWVRRLTGITDEQVRQAPPFADLLPRLLEDLEDAVLVAHHARFDVACLNSELGHALDKRLANRYLCTVELSRHLLPGSENYRLETLSRWLGLRHEQPHRAGSDAQATAELFCHMLNTVEAPWSDYLRPHPIRSARAEIAETNQGEDS